MTVEKMIVELETKCKSSKGFMGVYFDGVKTKEDLIENVKDEIVSIEINLDGGYKEDLFGMTTREAKGYLTKLNNFIKRHSCKHINNETIAVGGDETITVCHDCGEEL